MEKGSLFQKISKSQSKILPALEIIPSGRLLLQALYPWLQILPTALSGQYNFSALLTFARQLLDRQAAVNFSQNLPEPVIWSHQLLSFAQHKVQQLWSEGQPDFFLACLDTAQP